MCTAEKESNTIKSFESREGKMSLSQVLLGDSGESSVFLYVHTEPGDREQPPPASFRAGFSGNFFVQSLQGFNLV